MDRRILEAARALVGELGVGRTTVSAISARARVGKPSLYLRWHDKKQIVLAAIADLELDVGHVVDPSLAGALAQALGDDYRALVLGPHRGFLRAVLQEGAFSDEIAAALEEGILAPRYDRILTILRTRSPIQASADHHLAAAADLLHGQLIRDLVVGDPGGPIAQTVESVVHGIAC